MFTFEVNDMTCGHCISTITKAIRAVDAGAGVEADVNRRVIRVGPTEATATQVRDAIEQAGYTPRALESASSAPAPPQAGCCCGAVSTPQT